jgi:predicted nucleic acid-binding protein
MLVDTNVIIDFLRRRREALEFMDRLRGKPSISVITVMELVSGARSRREEREIDTIVANAKVLPVTVDIAQRAGEWLKHYRASHSVNDPDALIAATAEHHGLALATLNIKHFPMFAKLKPPY